MLATFASILEFFHYANKDIISKASSSDVSVHFFHKSSCAIFIPLDALDKFYKMTFYLLRYFHHVFFFCYWIVTVLFLLLDSAHLHDFALEKRT